MKGKQFIGYLILFYVIVMFAMTVVLINTRYIFSFPEVSAIDVKPDFSSFTNVSEKKQVFFEFFASIVTEQNAQLKSQREDLLALEASFSIKKN